MNRAAGDTPKPLATKCCPSPRPLTLHNALPAPRRDRHETPCGAPWWRSAYACHRPPRRRTPTCLAALTIDPLASPTRPPTNVAGIPISSIAKGAVGGCTMSPTTNPTIAPTAPSGGADPRPPQRHRRRPRPRCSLPVVGSGVAIRRVHDCSGCVGPNPTTRGGGRQIPLLWILPNEPVHGQLHNAALEPKGDPRCSRQSGSCERAEATMGRYTSFTPDVPPTPLIGPPRLCPRQALDP